MNYKKILITGGAGFVGSNMGCMLKEHYPSITVTAYDNLHRSGSDLTLPRLKKHGITFIKGDARDREALLNIDTDLIIECSAEPSVMAGVGSSPEYLIDTNLGGAINCFELARKKHADMLFLSTSRVYPVEALNKIAIDEEEMRFTIAQKQSLPGVSQKGISEAFPLHGVRTMYGATKLSAELLLQEYVENYDVNAVISRFGLIAGPWQFGKVDQGVITLWMARHIFNKPLTYIGFDGTGKQVRDVIHIDDVFEALLVQLDNMASLSGKVFNIGGGLDNSCSLQELTKLSQEISRNEVSVDSDLATRPGDIATYITDYSAFATRTAWRPKRTLKDTLTDIYDWIHVNRSPLTHILE